MNLHLPATARLTVALMRSPESTKDVTVGHSLLTYLLKVFLFPSAQIFRPHRFFFPIQIIATSSAVLPLLTELNAPTSLVPAEAAASQQKLHYVALKATFL